MVFVNTFYLFAVYVKRTQTSGQLQRFSNLRDHQLNKFARRTQTLGMKTKADRQQVLILDGSACREL